MTLPAPTIVLFDMDGTTVRHVHPRMLGALERLDDAIYKTSRWIRRARHEAPITERAGKPPRLIVHRMLHRMRRKPVEQIVQPCPGIFSLLNILKDHAIPMGIVSNGLGKGYGHDILAKFKLDAYFTSQTFREDITHSKPHPEPIIRALGKIKETITGDDVVWYIGDRHKDVVAALAAQKELPAKIIPFAYGLKASVAVLEQGLSPDHIIMNYAEFTQRIKPLFESPAYRAKSSSGS